MIRLLITCTCCAAIAFGVIACTDRRTPEEVERDAKVAGGVADVGSLFGLPRVLVEGVSGLILLGIGQIHGKRRGITCERKKHSPLAPKV